MTLVVPDQHVGPSALASGLVAVLLLGASAPAAALETVTIHSCYDGDTCRSTDGELRNRLAGLLPFDAAFAISYGIGHLFKRYLAFDCLLK